MPRYHSGDVKSANTWEGPQFVAPAKGDEHQGGVARRRAEQRDQGTRCIVADLLIGAPAVQCGTALSTFDGWLYRAAFPALPIVPPDM
jgi:hypothetical protein